MAAGGKHREHESHPRALKPSHFNAFPCRSKHRRRRRRGPRSAHDPLEASVPTNRDHRERCRKQLQGVFRHKGGDFPAWRISTRNVVSHARERVRGRPWACRGDAPFFPGLFIAGGQHRRELRGLERRRAGEGGLDGLTRSRWSHPVPMVSTARAAVGLSRGSKLRTARARRASSQHLRPVRGRRRAAWPSTSIRRRCVCRAKRIA